MHRTLQPSQRTEVWIYDTATGQNSLVHTTEAMLLEAPNWHPGGDALLLNGNGTLWHLALADAALTGIDITGIPPINNDHVLDPDNKHIYLSADGHIYRAAIAGGTASRVTRDGALDGVRHYLHGVSPDGKRLAFIGLMIKPEGGVASAAVYSVGVDGTEYRQITDTDALADGSEYSPDGQYIYFNTEAFSGMAQIARVPVDGGSVERLVESATVDWFPHVSPDGMQLCYLAYPAGTAGHPADLWVELRLATTSAPQSARTIAKIFGGQGTINVNSWSPDSRYFAYTAYPRA